MSRLDNASIESSNSSNSVLKKGPDVEVVDLESFRADSDASENYVFHKEKRLDRGLQQRHIQMLSLVGVFGTGLFLSSGKTLALAGNVGMFLSYVFVGCVVGLSQMAQIEISCFMPVTGSTVRHGEHFVDSAFGFALGWIHVYSSLLPGELSATAVVMHYWSDLNPAVWITVFMVLIILLNSWKIGFYGEVEFIFGCAKILLIVGLVIFCIVMDLGGVKNVDRIGFRYWKQSPFKEYYTTGSTGGFLAWWKAASSVVYAYGGVNSISFYGGETHNPRYSIYTAGKRIFFRVFALYLLTVFGLTLILSSKNSKIANSTGDATGSPFVIAISGAGIKVLPSIINAVVLSSAFSASNTALVGTSRTLFALAARGQAPKIFLKTNSFGMPYWGVFVGAIFLPLAYMSASDTASTVFGWFQNLTSANLLVNWMAIDINHIALQRALKAQGYSRDDLPYKVPFADYGAYISLFFFVILFLTGGFSNFLNDNFEIASFFGAYFVIPVFLALYFFWKILKKTKIRKSKEVDLAMLFRDVVENPETIPEPNRGWRVIKYLWE